MTISNFKSFKGDHKVGPFSSLTAIIGPNGAGKSCVLKAISFCLALNIDDMNKDNYAYIRNREAKPTEKVSVEMVLKTRLSSNLFLKRTLGPKDKDEKYEVNGKELPKSKYRDFIYENNVDVHSGLLFFSQGFSDGLIMKSPTDLRLLFEHASRSYEFKAQCDSLQRDIKEFQEEFDKLSEGLKNLNKQKKLISNQLSNCDFFNKISTNYDRLELDQLLACLLELDIRINDSHLHIYDHKKQLSEKNELHDYLTRQLRTNMEEKRSIKTENDSLEADLAKSQQDLAFLVEKRIKLENKKKEISSLQKSMESSLSALSSRRREILADKERIETDITRGDAEIEKLKSTEKIPKSLEKHFEALMKSTVSLQLEDKDEFELNNEERRVSNIFDRHSRELNIAQKDVKDTGVNIAILEKKIEIKQKNVTEEKKTLRGYERDYGAVQERLADMAESQKKSEMMRNELNEISIAIEKLKNRLGEQKDQDELLQKLYSNVDGFRGELGNLIRPVNQRFALALNIALGKAKSYLVVKSQKAAALVNEILKEKFIQRTVVIIEEVPPIKKNEIVSFRLECGQLGAAAYDIAEYDKVNEDIEPCLRYFLRGKAVCETIERANDLREKIGKKANIITVGGEQLRGTYISSIGNSEALNEDLTTKNAIKKAIESLKQKQEDIESQMKSTVGGEDIQNADLLKDRIATMNANIKQLELELDSLKRERDKLKSDIDLKENQRKIKHMNADDAEKELAHIRSKLSEIKETRNKKLRAMISAYVAENKVKEKEELMDIVISRLEASVDKEITLRQMITSKKQQIIELGLEDIEDKIASVQAQLDNYVKSNADNDREWSEVSRKCEALKEQIHSLTKKKDQIYKDYLKYIEEETKLRSRLRENSDDLDSIKASLRNRETEFQSSLRRKHQLFDDKQLEGIEVPVLKSEANISQSLRDTTKQLGEQNVLNINYMSLLERIRSGEGGLIREEAELDDEDALPDIYKLFNTEAAVEIRKHLTREFERAVKELNSLSTKFVNDETIDKEQRKLKELVEKIDLMKEQLNDIKNNKVFREDELKKYKALRNERFLGLFSMTSLRVREVYRRLNRNDSADATLTLEIPQDPTAGGLIFNPTPPNKKYIFDIASLSGGEKALASTALFFTLNDALRSPVILLDEADSALDKHNVALLHAYMKVLSQHKQIISVSHNSWFIRRSSMLLGVTKLPQLKSSACYSFDLEFYRSLEAADEDPRE